MSPGPDFPLPPASHLGGSSGSGARQQLDLGVARPPLVASYRPLNRLSQAAVACAMRHPRTRPRYIVRIWKGQRSRSTTHLRDEWCIASSGPRSKRVTPAATAARQLALPQRVAPVLRVLGGLDVISPDGHSPSPPPLVVARWWGMIAVPCSLKVPEIREVLAEEPQQAWRRQ